MDGEHVRASRPTATGAGAGSQEHVAGRAGPAAPGAGRRRAAPPAVATGSAPAADRPATARQHDDTRRPGTPPRRASSERRRIVRDPADRRRRRGCARRRRPSRAAARTDRHRRPRRRPPRARRRRALGARARRAAAGAAPGAYDVARPPPALAHRAGHAWEQVVLPARARAGARALLCPANLAPLAAPAQRGRHPRRRGAARPGLVLARLRGLAARACCRRWPVARSTS